jgi:hypothetical protein
MVITKEDLYKNQYDYETLKANIYVVSLVDILKTQKLTPDFCLKYILNKNFQLLDEEQLITIESVKKYQKHLSNIELSMASLNVFHKIKQRERIESVEDFESYMNTHL